VPNSKNIGSKYSTLFTLEKTTPPNTIPEMLLSIFEKYLPGATCQCFKGLQG
jgi:hypothetical protein